MESTGPSLDDCLKLLRGERDEQKLAGLLLAVKFCQGGDTASVLKVYGAVGARFIHRLLLTGMGKGAAAVKSGEDQEAFLRLSITLLAALCRVPEIASSEEMVSKIPLLAEIISKSSDPSIFEECYEFLLLVASASDNGITKIYEPGVMDMLAPHISTLNNGARPLEFAMQLLQLAVNRLSVDLVTDDNLPGMTAMVTCIARQFAVLQNAIKFDALHMLTTLLSSKNTILHEGLRSISDDFWATQIRVGIGQILQNRVVSTEKLQALLLADIMMSILGVNWLLNDKKLHHDQEVIPVDKFLFLTLESARIEVAVYLNELAYLKYEASGSSSDVAGMIFEKQRYLATAFSLIEKIIKLISNLSSAKDSPIKESTLTKMISGLNETITLVLDFLQDSKDHGQKKGNDILAAVRIVGSYLAEAPTACRTKIQDLLRYLLSVEGEEEASPFHSICFLLPMLCQITMDIDGCKALASVGGHKSIVECLVTMVGRNGQIACDNDTMLLACDTILNLLLNVSNGDTIKKSLLQICFQIIDMNGLLFDYTLAQRKELQDWLECAEFVNLLHALLFWTESCNDPSVMMMASSICTLVLDLTSEEYLLNQPNFDRNSLERLAHLIARSLNQSDAREDLKDQADLHHIIIAGYCDWADRFPFVRHVVENS